MSTKKQQIKIESILGGYSPTYHLSAADQYLDGIGIDPEAVGGIGGITGKILGGIMPTFSSPKLTTSSLGEAPMFITGSPNTTGVFLFGSTGSVYALSNTLGFDAGLSEWKLADESGNDGGNGNGMVAYNDYIYFSTATTVHRLGKMSATQPLMAEFFVATAGATTLARAQYPATRNVTYPSHVMHFHNDGKVYVADYENTTGDRPHGGLIHWFKTSTDGTGSTSGYAALILPPNFMPTAIESYGSDLAILCTPQAPFASGAIPKSGNSALFLWNTVDPSYYRHVTIKEPMATAMKNKNGELHILAGNIDTDVKLLKYVGGETFRTLATITDGSPPPAGAMEIISNMVCWGGHLTSPTAAAGLFTYGSRAGNLKDALHMPMRISDSTNTLPVVSCIRHLLRSPYPVLGWRTDTTAAYGLDQVSGSGTQASRFRTKIYNIGQPFRIRRIRIPLQNGVTAGDSIVTTVYVDTGSSSQALRTINTTNYPNSERIIDFNSISVAGKSNFYLDFSFTGTNQQGFGFPITIDLETDEL